MGEVTLDSVISYFAKMKIVKKWPILGASFIVVMTLVCYLPAIQGGYIWDDDALVTDNPTLRTIEGLRRIWLEIGALTQYYPMVFTSFWVEYHLWHLHPLGYHLVNVVLHSLNGILLWLLLRRLHIPGAWLAAAIFVLHPVHVESVAWISERKNVLSSCFYLLAFLSYLRFAGVGADPSPSTSSSTLRSPSATSVFRYYVLSVVLYLCALLSKTVTCTMPAALLLLLWWKEGHIRWRRVVPLIPYFAAGAALGLLTMWMEKNYVGAQGEEWTLSFVERCLVAGRALWFYGSKLFWPSELTFIYPRWQIDAGSWWHYLPPLAVVGLVITLWLFRKQIGKAPLVAVLFFVGTLTPALGFFDVYPMRYSYVADHFQYLASIGLIVLGVAVMMRTFQRLGSRYRFSGFVVYGIVLIVLGKLVWQQGQIYKDVELLWRDTISKNPHAWIAHNNLGEVLVKRGKIDEGIEHFKRCLVIKPDHMKAYNNLGNAYGIEGRFDEAITELMRALELNPRYAAAHSNLGNVYLNKGELDKAISEYKRAISINPYYAAAYSNLAAAYYLKGDNKLAIVCCDKVAALGMEVNPKLLEVLKAYR